MHQTRSSKCLSWRNKKKIKYLHDVPNEFLMSDMRFRNVDNRFQYVANFFQGLSLSVQSHWPRAFTPFRSPCSRFTVCMRLTFRQKNRSRCPWSIQSWFHHCIMRKFCSFCFISRSISAIKRHRCKTWRTFCDKIRKSRQILSKTRTIFSFLISTI